MVWIPNSIDQIALLKVLMNGSPADREWPISRSPLPAPSPPGAGDLDDEALAALTGPWLR